MHLFFAFLCDCYMINIVIKALREFVMFQKAFHSLFLQVQNADDNVYPESVEPTITFILQDSGIIVLNNERGFSAQNIRALCDVGNSTKKGSNAGYIGQKGIGFKSVFRVCWQKHQLYLSLSHTHLA